MFLVINDDRINDALEFWGRDMLPIMACEEMGELIQALSPF